MTRYGEGLAGADSKHAVSGVLGQRFERFRRLESRFVTHGFQMVLLLRLLLFLSPPLNWAIGATRPEFRRPWPCWINP